MKIIKAVVGVLRNKNQELLIAQRQQQKFMGGFWELSGGKIEIGETPEQAIIRELKEELNIQVERLSLRQTMTHQYEDRIVHLSVYNIEQYQNTPSGAEGQLIAWVKIDALNNYQLLPTMRALINSLILPRKYWITPAINYQSAEWVKQFEEKLNAGITLIQLRSKIALDASFITELYDQCKQNNVKLLLNTVDKTFNEINCDGWHITTNEMLKFNARPCSDDKLLGASTHNLAEALQAQKLGADFIVISPVQATQTHPEITPLGWNLAKVVVDKLNIPVYFLGGMCSKDLNKTLEYGAQGIAGISAF